MPRYATPEELQQETITESKASILAAAKEAKVARYQPATLVSLSDVDSPKFEGVTGGYGSTERSGKVNSREGVPSNDRLEGIDSYEVYPSNPSTQEYLFNNPRGKKKLDEQRLRLANEKGLKFEDVSNEDIFEEGAKGALKEYALLAAYSTEDPTAIENARNWVPPKGSTTYFRNNPLWLGDKDKPLNIEVDRLFEGEFGWYGRPLSQVKGKGSDYRLGEEGAGYTYTTPAPSVGQDEELDNFEKLRRSIFQSESSGDYSTINDGGYVGGYQMGAQALESLGYLKKGTYNRGKASGKGGNSGIPDPTNWTGKSGVDSLDSFISDPATQDKIFEENLNYNYKGLLANGTITPDTSIEDVAGYISAAHLLGVAGAKNLSNVDGNGTSGNTYFARGVEAVRGSSTIQPSTPTSDEEFMARYEKEVKEREAANRSTLGNVMYEAWQAARSAVPGAVRGGIELLDAGQELSTLPAQEVIKKITGDDNYDIDLISNAFKDSVVGSVDKFVGYDREADTATMGEVVSNIKEAGADITDFNSMLGLAKDPKKRALLTDATINILTNPSIMVSSLAELLGSGVVLGTSTKVALKALDKVNPSLGSKVDNVLATNRTKLGRERNTLKSTSLSKVDKASKVRELENSYTLTKKVADLVKGSAYRNADLAVRMNTDIEEYTANNDGEAPTGEKLLEMFVLNTLAASMEMSALKSIASSKVAKGSLKKAVASTAGNIVKGVGVEGTQETVDGIVQQINQKMGSSKYKDSTLEEVLSDASAEILAGTLVGASTGGSIAAVSSVSPKGVVEGITKGIAAIPTPTKDKTTTTIGTQDALLDEEVGVSPEERELTAENTVASLNRLNMNLGGDGVPINETNVGIYVTDIDTVRQVVQAADKNDPKYAKYETLYNKGLDELEGFIKTNPNVKLSKRTIEQFSSSRVLGSEESTDNTYDDNARKLVAEKVARVVLGSERSYDDVFKNNLTTFMVTNGVSKKDAEKVVKSYASVELEATVEERGYRTLENTLKLLLASGNPDKAKVKRTYGQLQRFLSSTSNSMSLIEQGISEATIKADTLNKSPDVLKGKSPKTVQFEIGYKKDNGSNYKINIPYDDKLGKYVVDLTDIKDRLASKKVTAKEINRILRETSTDAGKYVDGAGAFDRLYVPVPDSGTNQTIKKARKADETYFNTAAKSIEKILDTPGTINKAIVDDTVKVVNGKRVEGRASKWGSAGDYWKSNSSIVNTFSTKGEEYEATDVVLLHAIGAMKPKSGKGFTSSLYSKQDTTIKNELLSAIDSGATIVLDREYRDTKEGRRVAGAVKKLLTSNGYSSLGYNSSAYVKETEATKPKLERIRKYSAKKAANTKKTNNDLLKLSSMKAMLDSGVDKEGNELTSEDVKLLQESFDMLLEDVSDRAFTNTSLYEARSNTDTNVVTAGTTLVNEEGVSEWEVADSTDDSSVSTLSKDAVALLRQSGTPQDKALRKVRKILRERVKEVKAQITDSNVKPGDKVFDDESVYQIAKKELANELTEDAKVTELLERWKELTEVDKLEGNKLKDAVNDLLIELDLDTKPELLVDDLLSKDSIAIDKPPLWEKVERVEIFKGKEVVTSYITYTPIWDEVRPNTIKKFRGGKVVHSGNKRTTPITYRKVENDSTKVLKVSGTTIFNTIPTNILPKVFKDSVAKFTTVFNKAIKKPTEAELDTPDEFSPKTKGKFLDGNLELHNSPARSLVFDKEGNTVATTMAALRTSLLSTMMADKQKLRKGYKTTEQLAQMFQVRDHEVNKDMRDFARDIGAFKKTVATKIGKDALKLLGISKAELDDVAEGSYDRLVADLGNMALLTAKDEGIIQFESKQSNDLGRLLGEESSMVSDEAKVWFVNLTSEKKGGRYVITKEVENSLKDFDKMAELVPEVKTREVWPSVKKPSAKRVEQLVNTVRNDSIGMEVPEVAREALMAQITTPYVFDIARVESFLAEVDKDELTVKGVLGFIPIGDNEAYNKLMAEDKEVQEAINDSIDKSITDLRRFIDNHKDSAIDNKVELYFDFNYVSNGRYHLDSNTINPQADKLHRFLVLPKRLSDKVKISNGSDISVAGKDINLIYRASIGQAFGLGVDKESMEDIITYGNIMLSLSKEQLVKVRKDVLTTGESKVYVGSTSYGIEAEHLTHTLQALDDLIAIQEGNTEITSSLSVEFDSLTSGFANKTQQFPVLGNVAEKAMHEHFARVGVITTEFQDDILGEIVVDPSKGTSMADLLAKGSSVGFYDSYKNLARLVMQGMSTSVQSVKGKDKIYVDMFKGLSDVLPGSGNVLGTAEEDISSAMRKMFKNPFMIFNYSASISTITKNLGDSIAKDVFSAIAKTDITNKDEAGTIAAEYMLRRFKKDLKVKSIKELQDLIRTEHTSNIGGGKPFKSVSEMAFKLYGSQVQQVFEDEFGQFIEIQNLTNDAFKAMFRIFDAKRMEMLKTAGEKGYVTKKDQKDIIEALWNDFPYIAGPLSGNGKLKEIIPVTDRKLGSPTTITESARPPQTKLQGTPASNKVRPLVSSMDEAVSAGSVLPFHFIDGAEIAMMMKGFTESTGLKAEALAVHDAIVPSLLDADRMSWEYNKGMFEVNKNYSIMEELDKRINSITVDTKYLDSIKTKGLNIDKNSKGESSGHNFSTLFNALKLTINEKAKEVKEGRKLWYDGPLKDAWFANMVGTPGGVYKPGMTGPDMSYLEIYKNKYTKVPNVSVDGVESITIEPNNTKSGERMTLASRLRKAKRECKL